MDKRPPDEKERKKQKLRAIAAVISFLLILAAAALLCGKPLIKYINEPEMFRLWVDTYGIKAHILFVFFVAVQVIVAFIPGGPFELIAGYVFGTAEGIIICIIGTAIGELAAFLFVKKFGVKVVEVFFPREKINGTRFLNEPRRLNILIFILFFIPGTPKDLLTYCAGLTNISLGTFLTISMIARLPSIIVSVMGGNALGSRDYRLAVLIYGITFAVSIFGILLYNSMSKKKQQ